MEEFLRNYGFLILFGIMMFFMMRRGGGGCCGGHSSQKGQESHKGHGDHGHNEGGNHKE